MKPDKRLIGKYSPIANEEEAKQAHDKYVALGWPYRGGGGWYYSPLIQSIIAINGTCFNFYNERAIGTDTLLPLADLLAMEPEVSEAHVIAKRNETPNPILPLQDRG
jgi:hypothetical protein